MGKYLLIGEALAGAGMTEFVTSIIGSVTGIISLTLIAGVIGVMIAAALVPNFSWTFARKGYRFVTNALSGRAGKF